MDISVTASKRRGEKTKNTNKLNGNFVKSELWTNPEKKNVRAEVFNFRRHEGKIYRQANGGFEIKGKPRFEPDFFN